MKKPKLEPVTIEPHPGTPGVLVSEPIARFWSSISLGDALVVDRNEDGSLTLRSLPAAGTLCVEPQASNSVRISFKRT